MIELPDSTPTANHKHSRQVSEDDGDTLHFQRLESSRRAILSGWIISVIGAVCYCYAAAGSGQNGGSPITTLLHTGLVGLAATVFLAMGLGLWVVGSLVYLIEGSQAEPGEEPPNADD